MRLSLLILLSVLPLPMVSLALFAIAYCLIELLHDLRQARLTKRKVT